MLTRILDRSFVNIIAFPPDNNKDQFSAEFLHLTYSTGRTRSAHQRSKLGPDDILVMKNGASKKSASTLDSEIELNYLILLEPDIRDLTSSQCGQ